MATSLKETHVIFSKLTLGDKGTSTFPSKLIYTPENAIHIGYEVRGARPSKLAAMSVMRSGVESQAQGTLHFPGVSEVICLRIHHRWTK